MERVELFMQGTEVKEISSDIFSNMGDAKIPILSQ